jgi:hypothetical protein
MSETVEVYGIEYLVNGRWKKATYKMPLDEAEDTYLMTYWRHDPASLEIVNLAVVKRRRLMMIDWEADKPTAGQVEYQRHHPDFVIPEFKYLIDPYEEQVRRRSKMRLIEGKWTLLYPDVSQEFKV